MWLIFRYFMVKNGLYEGIKNNLAIYARASFFLKNIIAKVMPYVFNYI